MWSDEILLSKNKIRKSELATAVIKLELNHIFDLLVRLLSYKIIKTFGLSHSILAQTGYCLNQRIIFSLTYNSSVKIYQEIIDQFSSHIYFYCVGLYCNYPTATGMTEMIILAKLCLQLIGKLPGPSVCPVAMGQWLGFGITHSMMGNMNRLIWVNYGYLTNTIFSSII